MRPRRGASNRVAEKSDLLGVLRQDLRELVKAAAPSGANIVALLGRCNSRMMHRQARASRNAFEEVSDGRGRTGRAGHLPCLHQFPWRIDFEKFSLERVGRASRDAGGAPMPADADVTAPFAGVEYAGIDPPLDDLPRT